jgi:hypothetical protein
MHAFFARLHQQTRPARGPGPRQRLAGGRTLLRELALGVTPYALILAAFLVAGA